MDGPRSTVLLRYGVSLAVLLVAAAIPPASSQPAAPPNFGPNPNVGWVAFSGEFMAPPSGPGPVLRDPAHPRVSNDDYRERGAQPTFPMGDANAPVLQPWAREVLRKRNDLVLSGKPAFPRQASCYPAGMPAFLLYPVQPVYFIQSPKEVVMIWQADHQVRRVHLTDKHSPQVKVSWYGESIGRYEGDTLVVDTIGIDPRGTIDGFQTPHTDKLHVIERFHLTNGGKTLEVNLHIEDTGAFTTPWNAIQRYRRIDANHTEDDSRVPRGPLEEAVCAENNGDILNEGVDPIPQTDRPDF
jgi:hypothetical protein